MVETPRYELVNAKSQYGPYTDFDIAVAAIASPTARGSLGQHGLALDDLFLAPAHPYTNLLLKPDPTVKLRCVP